MPGRGEWEVGRWEWEVGRGVGSGGDCRDWKEETAKPSSVKDNCKTCV